MKKLIIFLCLAFLIQLKMPFFHNGKKHSNLTLDIGQMEFYAQTSTTVIAMPINKVREIQKGEIIYVPWSNVLMVIKISDR